MSLLSSQLVRIITTKVTRISQVTFVLAMISGEIGLKAADYGERKRKRATSEEVNLTASDPFESRGMIIPDLLDLETGAIEADPTGSPKAEEVPLSATPALARQLGMSWTEVQATKALARQLGISLRELVATPLGGMDPMRIRASSYPTKRAYSFEKLKPTVPEGNSPSRAMAMAIIAMSSGNPVDQIFAGIMAHQQFLINAGITPRRFSGTSWCSIFSGINVLLLSSRIDYACKKYPELQNHVQNPSSKPSARKIALTSEPRI